MTELDRKQKYALTRYRRMRAAVGLDEQELLSKAADDPEAIVPVLELMIDQIVRSEVIMAYTWIDSVLDDVIENHISGGRKSKIGRRSRRTLELVLGRLYPLQKLAIIKTFRKVPKEITSSIGAVDELRNGLVHSFHVSSLPKHRRTYKRRNIFIPSGIGFFRSEVIKVIEHFDPVLRNSK